MTKFLIVGLGNPGREYARNRHNVGFMAVDKLAKKHNTAFTRRQGKALITSINVGEHSVVLAKPQTFMNLSGDAVASLVRFYDLPLEQLMVCYDDIDLPIGAIRIRPDGGSAGQNGVKSLIEKLGTQKFPRLRVGVGRPPGRMNAAAYVLQDFDKFDGEVIEMTLDKALGAIETFMNEGLNAAMNKFNGSGQEVE